MLHSDRVNPIAFSYLKLMTVTFFQPKKVQFDRIDGRQIVNLRDEIFLIVASLWPNLELEASDELSVSGRARCHLTCTIVVPMRVLDVLQQIVVCREDSWFVCSCIDLIC